MNYPLKRVFFFILFFIVGLQINAFSQKDTASQKVRKINLIHADVGKFDNISGKSAQRLIGNVKAEHDGSILLCDSAYLYSVSNSMDAFGHVHINMNDSLDLYGDQVFYNGNTKIAEFHNNVRMVDEKATLYTDELVYDRNTGIGQYFVWGKIVDSSNVLTSKKGYYYSQIETVFFKDSVVVVNPDYIMKSDTLKYQTKTERIFFFGPSTIEGDSSFLYAEDGFYDSGAKEARLSKNAFIQKGSNTLSGDSIYYNKVSGVSKAFYNVVMTDTTNDVLITGEYGIYDKASKYAYIIDSAQAIFIDNQDSLFLHADTLMLTFDSAERTKELRAFYNMKFFKKDFQGMADSMVYVFADSNLSFYNKPIMWFGQNQVSSEQIDLYTKQGDLDSAVFQRNVFLVARDTVDSTYYNQVSGENMFAWFNENDLRKIYIKNKAESIYFMWEEDGTPVGMNFMQSKDMLIYLKDQQLQSITCIEKPNPVLIPLLFVNPTNDKLRGFVWYLDERPMKRADIFTKKEEELEIPDETIKMD